MTVYEAKTRAKTPCIEESETTALVFLLKLGALSRVGWVADVEIYTE